jgi:predicted nucleotidyltransferase
MLTKKDILAYLTAHKDEFSKHFGIVKLGLFGSYSRGTEKNESDIDILIELQDNTNDIYRKKQQFKKLLETHFQRKVDIAREKYLSPLAKEAIKGDLLYV